MTTNQRHSLIPETHPKPEELVQIVDFRLQVGGGGGGGQARES